MLLDNRLPIGSSSSASSTAIRAAAMTSAGGLPAPIRAFVMAAERAALALSMSLGSL